MPQVPHVIIKKVFKKNDFSPSTPYPPKVAILVKNFLSVSQPTMRKYPCPLPQVSAPPHSGEQLHNMTGVMNAI